jgi:hypothetical protein
MEIGISSEKIIDIGLNLAGYFTAGLLLLILRSFFPDKNKMVQSAVPNNSPAIDHKKKSPRIDLPLSDDSNSDLEFINLKGVGWQPQRNKNYQVRPSKTADKSRRNVSRSAGFVPGINNNRTSLPPVEKVLRTESKAGLFFKPPVESSQDSNQDRRINNWRIKQ